MGAPNFLLAPGVILPRYAPVYIVWCDRMLMLYVIVPIAGVSNLFRISFHLGTSYCQCVLLLPEQLI